MIKINLLGDDTVIDTSGTWVMIGYGVSLFTVLAVSAFLYYSVSASIGELTAEKENLDRRYAALQETTKEVHDLEKKKKELADKTTVISVLKKSKMGPVRVLDDLNTALPDKSWIVDLKESGGLVRISGLALDNQTIAAFMKALEASEYFQKVDLGESRQDDREGVKIKSYTLQSKISYAGFDKPKVVVPTVSPTPAATVTPAASEASPSPTTEETPIK